MARGSKIERGKDTWLLQVYCGADWRGKYKPVTRTFHGTAAQADRELAKLFAEVQEGRLSRASSITVDALADQYITERAQIELKRSSLNSVKTAAKIWIKPFLGKKKLNRLKKTDIQKWVDAMSNGIDGKPGVKPKTVKNYFSIFSTMMEYAIDCDYIQINPCRNVRLPRGGSSQREIFSPTEVEAMLEGLSNLGQEDLRYKVAVELGLWGGFRKEEICGFNRGDLDFDGSAIACKRSRLIGAGIGVYEDTTKTEKSVRKVVLPQEVMADIKALIDQQDCQKQRLQNQYHESEALIRKATGEPIYPQVLQRWFRRFCEQHDIRPLGLHSLRHTHASIISEMTDVSAVTAQRRLGHSNLTTTLNIYTHPYNEMDKQVAKNISKLFFKNSNGGLK